MNAAARLVHQGVISRQLVFTYLLTREQLVLFVLAFSVLFSALSIIYITHTTRVMHAAYQHHLVEQNRLHVQRSQLLLERSTWMMQARIQQLAENKLGMIVPNSRQVVVVRE